MPRFHNINGERVQFTEAEEAARDAEEAAWADGANDRAAEQVREERDDKLRLTTWPWLTGLLMIGAPTDKHCAMYPHKLGSLKT